jgi:hypothetical protein
MTDYTSEIDAWYQAIQYRTPPASELAQFNAQLQAGIITTAQAVSQIEASSFTQTYVDPVIREYQAAFGRVPDQAGAAYWVGQVAANPANLAVLSTTFANSAEFMTDYGASATTPASSTLVTALYTNVLGRAPDAAGLAYWSNSGLDAAQLLQAFAQSSEFITDTTPYVIQFQNAEVAGNPPTSGSIYSQTIPGGIPAYTYNITYGAPTTFTFTGTAGGVPVTGTVAGGPTGPISSTEASSNSNVTINASLGLNDFQSIVLNGVNNVLNADYTPGVGLSSLTNSNFPGSNFDQTGLNIRGVQTWNIQADVPAGSSSSPSTIIFTGDGTAGNLISGLQTVNFNDNSGSTSLQIGNNSEPVEEPNGANGFAINVSNAVGTGTNFVDVDIAAQAFTGGNNTINVGAYIVGGFPLDSGGSYIIPPFELVAPNDLDDYNPNWVGFEQNAFAISAGASAGPNGSTGFQNWVISSAGAASVGTINILALGGEGSTSAQTLTLTNPAGDNSATILYATAASDSHSTDWENLTTITLTGTTGNVVLTGAETDAQAGGWTSLGGGLLTSDTSALVTIAGGAGNSFYDLSSLTFAAATNTKASFDGGHGTGANSEIAFNNSVVANASLTNLNGTVVNISNIQVLDDTGYLPKGVTTFDATQGDSNSLQGGVINMADFNLDPLNTNYDLLSGPLGNLFYVSGGSVLQGSDPTFAGTDVAPKGFQLLQLLDADGSTQATLGQDLFIENGFTQFAVNMQDVADGAVSGAYVPGIYYPGTWNSDTYAWSPSYYTPAVNTVKWTGYDITIYGSENPGPSSETLVNYKDTLDLWLADDGINLQAVPAGTATVPIYTLEWVTQSETVTENWSHTYTRGNHTFTHGGSVSVTNTVSAWEEVQTGTETVTTSPALDVTALNVPAFTVDNYTTGNIYLPYESIDAKDNIHNYVILGSEDPYTNGGVGGFVFQPVYTVLNGTVNFYDNTTDTGGSPPGGPDNLVLGVTNFTADLNPVSSGGYLDPTGFIGYTTVFVDSTTQTSPPSSTLNDYGAGSLEIGATNVSILNAASTSHLIMDLPGTNYYGSLDGIGPAEGITVTGSATGQNLLQGSSGVVNFDNNGHFAPNFAPYYTGVLVSELPSGGVGNDTLTGGTASVGVDVQNALSLNYGDNFFPEGGIDVVNINHAYNSAGTVATAYSTVYVGEFDVCNSGGPEFGVSGNLTTPNWGVGVTYGQAITDIVNGQEVYVDGYGPGIDNQGNIAGTSTASSSLTGSTTSLLTIHGFDVGPNIVTGDTLAFNASDWAISSPGGLSSGGTAWGLETTDGFEVAFGFGTTQIGSSTGGNAILCNIGTAGEGTASTTAPSAAVTLDSIGVYANASALVKALTTASVGDIVFDQAFSLAKGDIEHILVAYNTGKGIDIADVTLTALAAINNASGITGANAADAFAIDTANPNLKVTAVDMVAIVGTSSTLNVGLLGSHNIVFDHIV